MSQEFAHHYADPLNAIYDSIKQQVVSKSFFRLKYTSCY